MKLILENWKKYLNEAEVPNEKVVLDVKKKIITAYTSGQNRQAWIDLIKREEPKLSDDEVQAHYQTKFLPRIVDIVNKMPIRVANINRSNYNPNIKPYGEVVLEPRRKSSSFVITHEIIHGLDQYLSKTDMSMSKAQSSTLKKIDPESFEHTAETDKEVRGEKHSFSWSEMYNSILRLRALLNRPFTESDLKRIRGARFIPPGMGIGHGPDPGTDLQDVLIRNKDRISDEEMVNYLNSVAAKMSQQKPQTRVAENIFENWRSYLKEQVEVRPESQIYCDMDGVLVDFDSGVTKLINSLLSGGELPGGAEKSEGYFKRMRKLQQELGIEWRASKEKDLDIKVVKNFMLGVLGTNPGIVFSNLSPLEDGVGRLWPFLNSTGRTVNILSAAVRAREGATMTSEEGKIKWLARLDPQPASIVVVQADQDATSAQKKAAYANTNGIPNILIDDSEKNTEAWRAAGGIAIDHIPKGSEATRRTLEELFNETSI